MTETFVKNVLTTKLFFFRTKIKKCVSDTIDYWIYFMFVVFQN